MYSSVSFVYHVYIFNAHLRVFVHTHEILVSGKQVFFCIAIIIALQQNNLVRWEFFQKIVRIALEFRFYSFSFSILLIYFYKKKSNFKMKVFIFPVECSKYLVIFLGFVHLSYSANILFYMGTASLGNRIATWPLVTELSNRGHTVTFLSMHPGEVVSHPSVKEVSIKRAVKKYGNPVMYKDSLKLRQENLHQVYWDLIQIDMILVCEAILKDKEIIEWVKVSKFDLVILDSFINDCGMGFSNIFGAKLILLGSSSLLMWQADAFGFGAEESWIPDMQRHFPQDMTYFQRLRNTMRRIRWHIFRDVHFFLQHEKLFKLYLKEYELPEMRDIEKNISLVLVNSHFSHEFARSLPPFIIPVSGMHISDKNKPLPKVSTVINIKLFRLYKHYAFK